MRDVKLVAYGSISEDDERLITNYLEEKGCTVNILSRDMINERMQRQEKVIDQQNVMLEADVVLKQESDALLEEHVARILELEALIAIDKEGDDGAVAIGDAVDGD